MPPSLVDDPPREVDEPDREPEELDDDGRRESVGNDGIGGRLTRDSPPPDEVDPPDEPPEPPDEPPEEPEDDDPPVRGIAV